MANLTNTSVVVNFEAAIGDRWQKDLKEVVRDVTMTLSGNGTAASGSQIPATALGFDKIYSADGPVVSSDNSQIAVASPSYDGTLLLLSVPRGTINSLSVATSFALTPTALTGTFNARIRGESSL